MMKWTLFCISSLFVVSTYAQQNDSIATEKIANQILNKGQCYNDLRVLCKKIGNRISGSVQADQAVKWGYNTMVDAGFDSVWLQPVMVPVWIRGQERLSIQFSERGDFITVPMLSLGNSQGTDGKELEAPVLMVNSFDEFDRLDPKEIVGKIIFFNYRFHQNLGNTFEGYSDAVKYRWMSPMKAAPKGALGIIIRSISTGADDYPHTGSTKYLDSGNHIPAVAIGNITADRLEKACKRGAVNAQIESECGMDGTKLSYNVIGQIRGTEKPNEYIIVGGHLDSWDVGEGAHDDGTGCVQSIEVLRTFKSLGIHPRHSIRAVLFMNEENGLKGGLAYADSVIAKKEKHILAIETDAGGFSPRGFELSVDKDQRAKIKKYAPLFLPYGVYDFEKDGGGADVGPLKKQGVVISEMLPDSQRYFDLHHTDNDIFEMVNHRELKLGATAMTMLVYLIDAHNLLD
jgi:carboxypeptidase Q